MFSIKLQDIPSFYHSSLLYQQYIENNSEKQDVNKNTIELDAIDILNEEEEDEENQMIFIPTNKYWPESQCTLAYLQQSSKNIFELFSICDYWMFVQLPSIVIQRFQQMTSLEQQELIELLLMVVKPSDISVNPSLSDPSLVDPSLTNPSLVESSINGVSSEDSLKLNPPLNSSTNPQLVTNQINDIYKYEIISQLQSKEQAYLYSCQYNQLTILHYLIESHTITSKHIHWQDKHGNNALMLAVGYNHLEIVKYLIENTICSFHDISLVNQDGWTVLHWWVCYNGNLSMLQYLLQTSYVTFHNIEDVDKYGCSMFMYLCSSKTLTCMKYLLETQKKYTLHHFSCEDKEGYSGLKHACIYGSLDILQYLLEHQYIVYEDMLDLDREGNSNLMWACLKGHESIVYYLLENSYCPFREINHTNHKGQTALMFACIHGNHNIVTFLLTKIKVNYKLQDNQGWNACNYAMEHHHEILVSLLQQTYGLFPNKKVIEAGIPNVPIRENRSTFSFKSSKQSSYRSCILS